MRRAGLTVNFQMCRGRPGHRDISVDDSLPELFIGFLQGVLTILYVRSGWMQLVNYFSDRRLSNVFCLSFFVLSVCTSNSTVSA